MGLFDLLSKDKRDERARHRSGSEPREPETREPDQEHDSGPANGR